MPTILIIDDEKDIANTLRDTLTLEKFDVFCAENGKKGLQIAKEKKIDLILLDLRLPDMDGYDVCRTLKSIPATASIPILMLSTRSKDIEKVVGLEIGADDYLTKPYNDLELLARIRVALRRSIGSGAENKPEGPISITIGPVEVNSETRQVSVADENIKLTRKEFDLLFVFVKKPGKVFSRLDLLNQVWGQSFESLQGTVDSHIKTLRKKLGSASQFIETVPGVGYRWAETLEEKD